MSEHANGASRSKNEIVAILSAASGPWAVVALVALLLFTASCTLDDDKLSRERENLRALCDDPVTSIGKELCRRYVEPEPLEPLY